MASVVGIALAVWLMVGTLTELGERIRLFREPLASSLSRLRRSPRASWGMTLGHLGLAVAIAGMAGASGWKTESLQVMKPGETVTVAGYDFTFAGAKEGRGPNYVLVSATFTVSRNGHQIVTLKPENRVYNVSRQPTTEAAIHVTFTGDLYAVIGDQDESGGFVTRLYFNPLVAWMWVGTIIMVFGGVLSLTDRRHRVGAPQRRIPAAASVGA